MAQVNNALTAEKFNAIANANINIAMDSSVGLGFSMKTVPNNLEKATDVQSVEAKVLQAAILPDGQLHVVLSKTFRANVYDDAKQQYNVQDINRFKMAPWLASIQMQNLLPELPVQKDGNISDNDITAYLRGAVVTLDILRIPEGTVVRDGEDAIDHDKYFKYFKSIELDIDKKKAMFKGNIIRQLSNDQIKSILGY